MAPEALDPQRGKVTTKSDIWSMGVVLWELLSDGAEPFSDMLPEQAGYAVLEGKRLEIPSTAPEPLRKLIESCWRFVACHLFIFCSPD
jgi:serine/threonine protein kinase